MRDKNHTSAINGYRNKHMLYKSWIESLYHIFGFTLFIQDDSMLRFSQKIWYVRIN